MYEYMQPEIRPAVAPGGLQCRSASRPAALVCLGAALFAMASCSHPASRPNILLIVIDTLRADRLGAYGNSRGLTPFVDELAARGTLFRNAYAPCSWTCPSVASLLTSRYPSQHNVSDFESVLADEEVSLAEALRQSNYVAAGFSANFRLTKEQGYAQGFHTWRADRTSTGKKQRGGDLRRFVENWLRRNSPAPTLLYLQYMEPHEPYDPPEPYRGRFLRAVSGAVDEEVANSKIRKWKWDDLSSDELTLLESLYDGEVASMDAELRLLFGELERQGFLDNAVVVVTADHGEEFREHGQMLHGMQLYNETVHVPLILLAPGYQGGRVVEENTSLINVAPTLLDLAGLPPQARFEGRSLVPLLERRSIWSSFPALFGSATGTANPPDVILELPKTGSDYDLRRQTEGIIRGSTKVLMSSDGKPEVYDLAHDPKEAAPNPPELSRTALAMVEALQRSKAAQAQKANVAVQTRPLDEATKEKLRALGYAD